MSDQYLAQRMADLTQRLLPLLTKEDLTQTAIADISLMHRSNPSQARPIIYRPAVCFMLQGAKELLVGNTKVTYEQMNYLLIPVMLPVSGRVSQASPDTPYVGLSFNKKGAAAPLSSMRGHQLRLHPRESAETQASATRPLSFSSSHAAPTCSRHFLALVDSEPHISRKVSSFNGNGSLCEAK